MTITIDPLHLLSAAFVTVFLIYSGILLICGAQLWRHDGDRLMLWAMITSTVVGAGGMLLATIAHRRSLLP